MRRGGRAFRPPSCFAVDARGDGAQGSRAMPRTKNEPTLDEIRREAERLRQIRLSQPRLSSEEMRRQLRAAATETGLRHPIKFRD